MNIRGRLILLFVSIVALISLVTSLAIYFFSADYREDDFYHRLENKGRITAKLLIEVDEVNEDVLKRIEKDNPINLSNEKIIIYNYQNRVLYTSDEESIIQIPDDLLDRVRLNGHVKFTQNEYEALGFLYTDRFDRFVVVVAATDIYGFGKLKNLRTILMIVFAINVVVISISGYFYVVNALKPIANVIREVDDISGTSLHRRLFEGDGRDEISRLAKTFNNMLGRIESAFTTQRNFIANASHELRNPHTAILGQIDVCLINPRTPAEYQDVLRSLREDITNLKTMSDRLLLLAQADLEEVERRFSVHRADQLLWESKAELVKLHPAYSILIELDAAIDDDSKLNVLADDQLLKSAFVNIMDNGCKYSPNQKVTVKLQNLHNRVVLEFVDRGIGIRKEDLPHIFEPFYRGQNVKGIKGSGIGLSLVSRIIKSHLGSIDIASKEDVGTTIIISLPVAASV